MYKPYNWKEGPDLIQEHSIAKHDVLRSYLSAYFTTLASHPHRDNFRITLVDGFAGGGQYRHYEDNTIVDGSPIICLEAVREAEAAINKWKTKTFKIDASYFFIEKDKHAFFMLEHTLKEKGYTDLAANKIYLHKSRFDEKSKDIISYIKNKSKRSGRSIFILDQYGYKDVPKKLIKEILTQLPKAEIILTFAVDSLINFAGDHEATRKLLIEIGLRDFLKGKTFSELKTHDNNWRRIIQTALYKELVEDCGAKHFTPFFIRNRKGHGDFWLVHLSQHHRARDVMTKVHWEHHNNFIHYSGQGLDMFNILGYDPDFADKFSEGTPACTGFEFDDDAQQMSINKLNEQIPRIVYADDNGLSFGELFATTCNSTPASSEIYKQSLAKLAKEKLIEIIDVDGKQKFTSASIKDGDQIREPSQKRFIF